MGRVLVVCAMISGSLLVAEENDLPVIVADSGSKQVDGLVAELVSRRPAPIPMAGSVPKELQEKVPKDGRYATESDGSPEMGQRDSSFPGLFSLVFCSRELGW